MEFALTLTLALVCIGSPTEMVKTVTSVLWLAILFVGFITSPDE